MSRLAEDRVPAFRSPRGLMERSGIRSPKAATSALAVIAVATFGGVAEWRSGGFDAPIGVPDLLTGVWLAVVGVVLRHHDAERVGWLFVAAAAAWFAGNVAAGGSTGLSTVAEHLALVHRAVIYVALVTFPSGRLGSTGERAAAVVAVAGTALTTVAAPEAWTIAWAAALLIGFAAVVRQRRGVARAAGVRIAPAVVALGAAVAVSATLLLVYGRDPPRLFTILVYQAGIALTAAMVLQIALVWRRQSDEVADAVVEVALSGTGHVAGLLAAALRDPTVEVAFVAPGGHGDASWVDEHGAPVRRATASRRNLLSVDLDGALVAEVGSEVDLDAFPPLRESVRSAIRLIAHHARLQAGLRKQVEYLKASRLRLLLAEDDARTALSRQLENGVGRTLVSVRAELMRLPTACGEAQQSLDRLDGLERDLSSLAAGLGPTALAHGDVVQALSQLAQHCGFPVRVDVDDSGRLMQSVPADVATTLYFVCAEAIANAGKHAGARAVMVKLAALDDAWVARVSDDGRGGASASEGSGLQHLIDRVRTVGGRLQIESPLGAGTRITVELPRLGAQR